MSEAPKPNPLLRAWAAGIFDGKAVIADKSNLMYIDATDEPLMKRFVEVIGVGKVNERPHNKIPALKRYRWEAASLDDMREAILFVAPFLSPRKTKLCADLLSRIERNPYWLKKFPEKAEKLVVAKDRANLDNPGVRRKK